MEKLNTTEKNILSGILLWDARAEKSNSYSYRELHWLVNKAPLKVKNWITADKDGGGRQRQSLERPEVGGPDDMPSVYFELEAAILHLSNTGHIRTTRVPGDNDRIDLALTQTGLNLARSCSTLCGRVDLWYRERKGGVIGIIITVLVSIITAVITTKISA